MGVTTFPEAVTRVVTAGVGGEKRGRDIEGAAESDIGRAEVGEGRGGSGRDVEGLGRRGAGRGACTGRGSGRGAVKEIWGLTTTGIASRCGDG